MYITAYIFCVAYRLGRVRHIQFIDEEKHSMELYYETLDKIKFSKDSYRLAIYIDISNYEQKFLDIHETRLQNQAVCNNPKNKCFGNLSLIRQHNYTQFTRNG